MSMRLQEIICIFHISNIGFRKHARLLNFTKLQINSVTNANEWILRLKYTYRLAYKLKFLRLFKELRALRDE